MKSKWLHLQNDKFNCYIRKSEIVAIIRDWDDESMGMYTGIELKNRNRLYFPLDADDIFDKLVGKESEA